MSEAMSARKSRRPRYPAVSLWELLEDVCEIERRCEMESCREVECRCQIECRCEIDCCCEIECRCGIESLEAVWREDVASLLAEPECSWPGRPWTRIAAMIQHGLLERAGTGLVRVTRLALSLIYPESREQRYRDLTEAAMKPALFRRIRDHFQSRHANGIPPKDVLVDWLAREGLAPKAASVAATAFLETFDDVEWEWHTGGMTAPSLPSPAVAYAAFRIAWPRGGETKVTYPEAMGVPSIDGNATNMSLVFPSPERPAAPFAERLKSAERREERGEATSARTDRRPRYPALSLWSSIDLAGEIKRACGTDSVPREAVVEVLGRARHMPSSRDARRKIAALAQYGLVERAGKGRIRVTKMGEWASDPTTRHRWQLETAAMKPALFQRIRRQFQFRHARGIPPKGALLDWLGQEGFAPKAASVAAEAFLDTFDDVEWKVWEGEGTREKGIPPLPVTFATCRVPLSQGGEIKATYPEELGLPAACGTETDMRLDFALPDDWRPRPVPFGDRQ